MTADPSTLQNDYSLSRRCNQLLDADEADHLSDIVERRRRLRDIAAIEAEIDSARIRGEVAIKRGTRALAAGLLDDAVAALSTALGAFGEEPGKYPRRLGDCWILLTHAYEMQRWPTAAAAAMRNARNVLRGWDDQEAYTRQLEVATKLARLLTRNGDAVTALTTLDAAADLEYEDFGAATDHAQLMAALVRAEALVANGEFQRARHTVDAITEPADARGLADLADARGFICASAGQSAEARAHYRTAVDRYRMVVAEDDDTAVAESYATCTMNLAAALGDEGNHTEAVESYHAALAMFDALAFDVVRKVECRLNMAAQALSAGDDETAARQLSAVAESLSGNVEFMDLRAGLATNRGIEASHRGDHVRAADHHGEAHRMFLHCSSTAWAARAAINRAASTIRARPDADPVAVADELIPALLYLDHMRFQFPTPAARQAWREPVARAYALAFELAADNPQLVAELIENIINGGAHSAIPVVAVEDSGPVFRERRDHLGGASVGGTTSSSGAGLLVATAILPMHPPPKIRMPNGRTVLADHHRAAVDIYGQIPYAAEEVVDVDVVAVAE